MASWITQNTTADGAADYKTLKMVGIGTATPAAMVHAVASSAGVLPGQFDQPANTGYAAIQFLQSAAAKGHIGYGCPSAGNTAVRNKIFLGSYANIDTAITTNDTVRLTVKNDGKVGIGTTSPGYTLEVAGNAAFDGTTLVVDSTNDRVGIGTSAPSCSLEVKKSGAAVELVRLNHDTGTDGQYSEMCWYDQTGRNAAIRVTRVGYGIGRMDLCATNGAYNKVVLSVDAYSGDGRIGIGTTTPNATLHSTGTTIVGVGTSAVASGDMGAGQLNVWVDESNNKLKFQVKYSTSTVKTGEVSLS